MCFKAVMALLGVFAVAALSGCSNASDPVPSDPTSKTHSPSPFPVSAEHYTSLPDDQVIVAAVDDKTGTATLGSHESKKRNVLVYVTCSGPGQIKIVFQPLGSYPLVCNQTGAGSLNTFGLAVGSSYTVSIEGGAGQVWAATLAETDTVN